MKPDSTSRVYFSLITARLIYQGLQLTLLIHFSDNVTTANQFAINKQLRKGWPIGHFRQRRSYFWITEDIDLGEAFAAGHQNLCSLR